jgi:phenylacetate-CoA ligase
MGLGDRLYRFAPIWLQNAMVSLYGARLRQVRHGRRHRAILETLRATQWLSREELNVLQAAELVHLLERAADTPLYRTLWSDSGPLVPSRLDALPLLRKTDLLRAGSDAIPGRYARSRLHEIHTGGTTGTPLTVYCTREALQRNYAFFSRFREWAGVSAHPRVATFAGRLVVPVGQNRPPFWRTNRTGNAMLFSSYHLSPQSLSAYCEALTRFRPELIDSYPSSLAPIARFILSNGRWEIRPKAIITSSETLEPGIRKLFESAFGCRVYDHYGAAEMAALITQCEEGSYHPNPEFGIVEVLIDGRAAGIGETGEIVATGFVNPAMPMVRYATGDLATAGGAQCRCGRAFPVLTGLEGRRDDVLTTPEGRWIGRLDPIFKSVESILESRIVQDAPDHVRVEVVGLLQFGPDDARSLAHQLSARLGPSMRIDVLQVASLPRTARGKLRGVVSLLRGHPGDAGDAMTP